jgi:hypothetical protein
MFVNHLITFALFLGSLGISAQTTIAWNNIHSAAIATSTILGNTYDGEGATTISLGPPSEALTTVLVDGGEGNGLTTSILSTIGAEPQTADNVEGTVTSSLGVPLTSTSGEHDHQALDDRHRA